MGWAAQGTWSHVFAASNSPQWCYQELKFWPVWKHEKDITASWCIILGFGGFAWTSAPRMGEGVGAFKMLSRQLIPCGLDFTSGPGTAREQITEYMRKGCLRSSLLPVAQTHKEFCNNCNFNWSVVLYWGEEIGQKSMLQDLLRRDAFSRFKMKHFY